MTHYPPTNHRHEAHSLSHCVFAHLHMDDGMETNTDFGERNGVSYSLTSSYFAGFKPVTIA